MKSKIRTDKFGIATMRNNFIYKATEETMSALVENGIPQYFLKFIQKVILKEKPADPNEPKNFSVEDLEFGFVIFLLSCAASSVIFLLEVFVFYGGRVLRVLVCGMVVPSQARHTQAWE